MEKHTSYNPEFLDYLRQKLYSELKRFWQNKSLSPYSYGSAENLTAIISDELLYRIFLFMRPEIVTEYLGLMDIGHLEAGYGIQILDGTMLHDGIHVARAAQKLRRLYEYPDSIEDYKLWLPNGKFIIIPPSILVNASLVGESDVLFWYLVMTRMKPTKLFETDFDVFNLAATSKSSVQKLLVSRRLLGKLKQIPAMAQLAVENLELSERNDWRGIGATFDYHSESIRGLRNKVENYDALSIWQMMVHDIQTFPAFLAKAEPVSPGEMTELIANETDIINTLMQAPNYDWDMLPRILKPVA